MWYVIASEARQSRFFSQFYGIASSFVISFLSLRSSRHLSVSIIVFVLSLLAMTHIANCVPIPCAGMTITNALPISFFVILSSSQSVHHPILIFLTCAARSPAQIYSARISPGQLQNPLPLFPGHRQDRTRSGH